MGNSAATERFEHAAKSKMLTGSELELESWEKVTEKVKKISPLRTIDLSKNKLEAALPHSFLYTDPIMQHLKVLDLSSNRLTNVDALSHLVAPNRAAGGSKKKSGGASAATAGPVYPLLPMVLDVVQALQADGKKAFKVYPLESLNLSNNRIESLPPCFSLQFPHLKTLKLAKNKDFNLVSQSKFGADESTSSSSAVFLGAVGLVDLDLSETSVSTLNPIFDIAVCPIRGASSSSSAGGADIKKAFGDYWAKSLTKLNNINCNGCKIQKLTFGSPETSAFFDASLNEKELALSAVPSGAQDIVTKQAVQSRFGRLQVINASQPNSTAGSQFGIEEIDPLLYGALLNLNRISFDHSKVSRQKIVDVLKRNDHYRVWEKEHADVINRQVASGAEAHLMD